MAKVTQFEGAVPECTSAAGLKCSGLISGATLEEGLASFLEPGLSRTTPFPYSTLSFWLEADTSLLFVLS